MCMHIAYLCGTSRNYFSARCTVVQHHAAEAAVGPTDSGSRWVHFEVFLEAMRW